MSGREFFLRENIKIHSNNEYKQVMLTGYLSLICIAIGMFYLAYDYWHNVTDFMPFYFLLLAVGFLSWKLNRDGKHFIAKFILLMAGNIIIFLVSSKAPMQGNAHLFYLVVCLAAYALFGFENRKTAFFFTLVSLSGFSMRFVYGISIFPTIQYPDDYSHSSLIINFISVTITTSLILYVMVKVNYQSEEKLKEKQEEIESQNQCLTKANTELDQFVYSASHDLRSPLTSIMGLVTVAKRSENPREVVRCLDMIDSRVKRLDDLIKDIVSFSRNSRVDVNKQSVNVHRTVSEILEDFSIEEFKHTIDFKLDIPMETSIDTDPTRLKIILSNLIGNSIKHHDKRNANPFVAIQFNPCNNGFNAITVSDNGPGIALEYQSKIFDMFYRANERAEGSGLGLYIVKETITKLSGSIQLESSPGKGTTFTISLPN
ncbi:MAG TPA: HAMP domain-containing sensor histidine kinase [Chryseolinea sp.]|nr:HAMP domain-containing sensor histidine kinase [Chryseolinea sp.]HPM30012.1 HAMP domain-containing sensor histidine kinase [Chryseolinea sp.]